MSPSAYEAALEGLRSDALALLQQRLGTTTVYVTHDQVEAMTMGDRVAVIRKGRLQQVDSPRNLYDNPDNLFVAGFIGSPSMNFVYGKIEGTGDQLYITFAGDRVKIVNVVV